MAAQTIPAFTMNLHQARARWAVAQGLTTPAGHDPATVVGATGWLRTLGGIDAYLALAARLPGVTRAQVDADLAAGRLRVANAARGCIYLIPEQHRGLALAIADRLQRPRLEKDCQKVAIDRSEIEALGAAVLEALARGPLTTDAFRGILPPGTIRTLGDAGKKAGISSPLPLTLRFLELDGRIERVPVGTTLDTERYHWVRTSAPPVRPADPLADLARFFFRVAGPATLDHFAEWSGFGKREVAAAMQAADLVPVAVEGFAPLAWVAGGGPSPAPEGAHLLAFEDNLFVLHGGPAPLTEARHHDRPLAAWGSYEPATFGTAKHISERVVLLDGGVAGWWDWDATAGEPVVCLFDGPTKRADLQVACDATARILKEIGHARSFLLDTDEAVARRAARLRV